MTPGELIVSPQSTRVNQFLCIVPARGMEARSRRVFLPFEGDSRLNVILSKAFLLAKDTRIKDATILSQIRHGGPP